MHAIFTIYCRRIETFLCCREDGHVLKDNVLKPLFQNFQALLSPIHYSANPHTSALTQIHKPNLNHYQALFTRSRSKRTSIFSRHLLSPVTRDRLSFTSRHAKQETSFYWQKRVISRWKLRPKWFVNTASFRVNGKHAKKCLKSANLANKILLC